MSNFFQPYIYGIIKEELKRVEESHKAPVVANHYAIMEIVKKDVDEAIQSLISDGLITRSININQIPLYGIAERK
ncbi:hypothetical protein [Muribaculum intestinale]|jgi:hypothetical protein|uniref:hypothetical protein n=1 Tax=Muribaculum intestinale TaxID=1796646 RepID=UPI00242DDDD1|nr:hypothetical protein [Muribaculum intestinale]